MMPALSALAAQPPMVTFTVTWIGLLLLEAEFSAPEGGPPASSSSSSSSSPPATSVCGQACVLQSTTCCRTGSQPFPPCAALTSTCLSCFSLPPPQSRLQPPSSTHGPRTQSTGQCLIMHVTL